METEFKDIIDYLTIWSEKHGLIETAIKSCKKSLENSIKEDQKLCLVALGGFSMDDIHLHFAGQSLVFKHNILEYPFVETTIELCISDVEGVYLLDRKPIGRYRLITKLDGEIDDDYLEIYHHIDC